MTTPNTPDLVSFKPLAVGDIIPDGHGLMWRILATDFPNPYPVCARTTDGDRMNSYTREGSISLKYSPHDSDLVRTPVRVLPTLPEGFQWHRPDAITPEMIAEGYRPLVEGETRYPGDEYLPIESNLWKAAMSKLLLVTTYPNEWSPHRTKRPLPGLSMRKEPLGELDFLEGTLVRRANNHKVWWTVTRADSRGFYGRSGVTEYGYALMHLEYLLPGEDIGGPWDECSKMVPTFSYSAESLPVPPPTAPAPAASPLPELFDIEEARRMLEGHHDRIKALEELTEKLDNALLQFPSRQEIIALIHNTTNSWIHETKPAGKPVDTGHIPTII